MWASPPGGDQSDDRFSVPVAMADNETSRLKTITHQQETFFFPGVIRVVDQTGTLVEEHRLSFLEGDAMLSQIGSGLVWIPAKSDIVNSIILAISIRLRLRYA